MLKAPKFWYLKKDSLLSNSLYPFSLIFRLGTKIRNLVSRERKTNLPIICVGNIVVGGAGKTPVALKIGNMLIKAGYKPHFVSKGYGGLEKNNTLVNDWHSPKSVGDEPLLLSEIAPTWIGLVTHSSIESIAFSSFSLIKFLCDMKVLRYPINTIGVLLSSILKFFIILKIRLKDIFCFNALSCAFCIIGPSAIGSVKGTPISMMSTPASTSNFIKSGVDFISGSPATR